jgi:hypothetical protein
VTGRSSKQLIYDGAFLFFDLMIVRSFFLPHDGAFLELGLLVADVLPVFFSTCDSAATDWPDWHQLRLQSTGTRMDVFIIFAEKLPYCEDCVIYTLTNFVKVV